MRFRWVSGVLAVALTLVIGVVGPARPAHAGPLDDFFEDLGNALVDVVNGSGQGSDPALEAAKQEILAAVRAARQDILDQMDEFAGAEIAACTTAATTAFVDINRLPPDLLGPFTSSALSCATLSVEYFHVVQNLTTADKIGRLMGVVYAIAMAAFAFFGLPTVDLARQLITGYEAVVARFRPQCREWRVVEPDIHGRPFLLDIFYRCTAYNGDWAQDVESYVRGQLVGAPLNRAKVDADATRNTSRALALKALPGLREAVAREGTP